MQRQSLTGRLDARTFDGLAEVVADAAVVESAAFRVREHEVVGCLVAGDEPALTKEFRDGGGEDHLASGRWRLQFGVNPLSRELAVDPDHAFLEIDVVPAEAERLTDPQTGEGEELEQDPIAAGVVE